MVSTKKNHFIESLLKNLLAWFASLLVLVPLILIILNAFKGDGEALTMTMALPKTWNWSNFAKVIEKGKLVGSFFNSLLYAGTSTVLTVILASMAAYIFSRRRSKKMGILYMYIVLGMVIPVNYVTLTKIMQLTHLVNTAPGIILLYTAMQIPFSVFLIFGFVSKIPSELDEAAILDGSTPFQLFIRVILPMLKPAVITAGVLCFLNTWNEFIMPLYFLHSSGKWPMTLAIYNFFGQYEMSWNLICADVILTCLPVVLLYVTCQKYIVGGQTEGAVKG